MNLRHRRGHIGTVALVGCACILGGALAEEQAAGAAEPALTEASQTQEPAPDEADRDVERTEGEAGGKGPDDADRTADTSSVAGTSVAATPESSADKPSADDTAAEETSAEIFVPSEDISEDFAVPFPVDI